MLLSPLFISLLDIAAAAIFIDMQRVGGTPLPITLIILITPLPPFRLRLMLLSALLSFVIYYAASDAITFIA